MLTLFFSFLIFSRFSLTHAQTLIQVEAPLAPVENQYELRGEFDYLSTSANFPPGGGASTALPGGGKLTNMTGLAQIRYDYDRAWRGYVGFSGGQTSATGYDTTSTTPVVDTTSNSGLDEAWVGGQYWIRTVDFDLVPQVDMVYPFFRPDITNGTSPLLGEGAVSLRGGGWFMYHFGRITPYIFAGYDFRDQGRAGLIPYRLGGRYRVRGNYWVQAEFRGYETAIQDSNTGNRSVRDGYLTRVDGASYEFYSLNPGHGEISLSGGLQFGTVGVYAGGSISAYGRSSADDYKVLIGLTFLGKTHESSTDDYTPVSGSRERDETYFDSRPEKYDESLFRENSVVAPPPPPLEEDGDPEVLEKPKPPPKKRRPRPSTDSGPLPSVELLMKDTTKSLEKQGK